MTKPGFSPATIQKIQGMTSQSSLKGIAVKNHDPLARIVALEKISDREFLRERAEKDKDQSVRLASAVLLISRTPFRFFDFRDVQILKRAARVYNRLGQFEFAGRMEELAGDYRSAARDYRRANIESEAADRTGMAEKINEAITNSLNI